MARKEKPRKNNNDVEMPEVLKAIGEDTEDLYRVHEKQILRYLEESANQKLTLNFAVEFDNSQSEMIVETRMRTSQAITDKRTRKMNPAGALDLFTPDQMDATRKRSARNSEPAEEFNDEAA
jgi:hypothetical protein